MFTNRFYATIIDLLIHLRITIFYTSRRVGIGRRDRLKICCPQGRVGSSPTAGIETGILSGGFPFFAVCFRPRPLDLDLSTSGVVCGHLSTNHPRGRSIPALPSRAQPCSHLKSFLQIGRELLFPHCPLMRFIRVCQHRSKSFFGHFSGWRKTCSYSPSLLFLLLTLLMCLSKSPFRINSAIRI